jgi:hypothetical protein
LDQNRALDSDFDAFSSCEPAFIPDQVRDRLSLENAMPIRSENEALASLKKRLESGLFRLAKSALARLEKSLKNPNYSIAC